MTVPAKYTESELQYAMNRERLVGWLQGAGVLVAAALLWKLLGWIPVILVLVGVVWVVGKLVSKFSHQADAVVEMEEEV